MQSGAAAAGAAVGAAAGASVGAGAAGFSVGGGWVGGAWVGGAAGGWVGGAAGAWVGAAGGAAGAQPVKIVVTIRASAITMVNLALIADPPCEYAGTLCPIKSRPAESHHRQPPCACVSRAEHRLN